MTVPVFVIVVELSENVSLEKFVYRRAAENIVLPHFIHRTEIKAGLDFIEKAGVGIIVVIHEDGIERECRGPAVVRFRFEIRDGKIVIMSQITRHVVGSGEFPCRGINVHVVRRRIPTGRAFLSRRSYTRSTGRRSRRGRRFRDRRLEGAADHICQRGGRVVAQTHPVDIEDAAPVG